MREKTVPSPTMAGSDWVLLLALSVLWGGSFLFVGLAVHDLPSLTIVASRVVIAASILGLVMRLDGLSLPRGRNLDFLVLAVLAHAAPFTLITWGQHHIPSGLAAILNATTPLFTMLVLRVSVSGTRIGVGQALGLGSGFLGVCVLMGPKTGGDGASILGGAAVLLAAFCYGLSGYWVRRFADLPAKVTATGAMLATSILMVPLALLVEQPWTLRPGPVAVGAVVALGAISTALAYLIFYPLLRRVGAGNATLVTFLVPVNAVLLGALILAERLEWTSFAGMALISAGLAAIDGRPWRWLRARMAA